MNGRLTSGSQTDSGRPVVFASSIETPVTPPSMKLLDSRNPFRPMPADRMPSSDQAGVEKFRQRSFHARVESRLSNWIWPAWYKS